MIKTQSTHILTKERQKRKIKVRGQTSIPLKTSGKTQRESTDHLSV